MLCLFLHVSDTQFYSYVIPSRMLQHGAWNCDGVPFHWEVRRHGEAAMNS